ncbi:MAG: TonB-dependent receptor [Acidobacteriota bacterium]
MKGKFRNIFSLLIFSSLLVVSAIGQNVTSTVVGQVNDPSGSGVPGAHITVTNINTGISTAGIASSTGSYSVSDLQPGTYTVSASAPGFSTFNVSGIVVAAAHTIRVDVPLKVGSVSETVHVTGGAPLITTDSASIGATLNTQQIRDLPSGVQSIAAILATVPGAVVGAVPSAPLIGGATHWGASNFTLNGIALDDIGNGGAAYAFTSGDPGTDLINQPPLDTLQEFQVVGINENAEFSDVSTIIMVTKQGTNQFHGDAYEFFKNAVLNANSYQLNATGQQRPQNNLNQFGGTIGGPIIKNKAFFFFSPVFYRSLSAGLAQQNFPSAAMKNGDFKALLPETQLYDPLTGQPFQDNQIPTTMFAPQLATLLKYLPDPTDASSPGLPNGPNNYIKSVGIHNYMDSYTGRGDYQIRTADSLFGVFTYSYTPQWNVFANHPETFGNDSNFGFKDISMNLGETHTFNPTTLNDFRAAWFRHNSYRQGQNSDFDPTSLFPQLTPGINRGLPQMAPTGYSNVAYDYGYGAGKRNSDYNLEFADNFTKVLHNHAVKMGFDESGYKVFNKLGVGSLGSFSFSGVWTGNKGWPGQPQSQGNAFADYLLGYANAATRSTVSPDTALYNRITEGYAQDSWQVNPQLTLNYGIRYMYQAQWGVLDNARSLYDQANNKIALPQNSATPTLPKNGNATFFDAYLPYFETTQSIGLSTSYMKPPKNNWSPRIGFAFRPVPNTVIRGGYGVYYDWLIFDFSAWDYLNLPFGSNTETANSKLPGTPTAPYLPDITFADPFGTAGPNLASNPTLFSVQPNIRNPRIQQYNLTVEHQFHQNWAARASYVGSVTTNLPWFEEDINQPAVQIPNTPFQEQRPEQPWAVINSVRDGARQNFNQLQLEATRRYENGVSFQAEYAWTRSLDNVEFVGGPQQIAHPNLDYGNSTSIRTHTLIFNYLYDLPFGHGKRWLNNSSGLVNALAGGWQVSGITTYATGLPFSVNFTAPSNFIGWVGNDGTNAASATGRADRIPGVPVYLSHSGHDVIKGVPYFNPAAFGPPQPWTWGDSGRNILWGPGTSNWDISAMKHILLPWNRLDMTIRADFFDAFNHFNLSNPSNTVASTQYGGVPQPTAGMVTTGTGNRNIQLGARVSF